MVMHLLGQLVDGVRCFQCPFYMITSYPFGNLLGELKRNLKSGFEPLEQVCKRTLEEMLVESEKPSLPEEFKVESFVKDKEGFFYVKRLKYRQFTSTPKVPNNAVMIKNGKISIFNKMTGSTK